MIVEPENAVRALDIYRKAGEDAFRFAEVVNTTKIPGLARRATRVLRDQGFDVVEMTGAGPALDSTLVLDRSFHPEWAATVAKILGPLARVESRPDSSRYLDVTVLLGATWKADSPSLVP